MATSDELRATFLRYATLMTAGEADAIAELYAEDGTLEDPVGGKVVEGREAIRAWYRVSAGKLKLALSGPVRVCGHEAAAPLVATLGEGDATSYIDIIDVMTVDDAGQIKSMRAFWSTDAIRSAAHGEQSE